VGVLQRFERRLEGLVGNAFARLFKGQVEPVEVAKALQREAEEKRAIVGSGRVLVPNRYDVELGSTDYERLAPWEAQLTQTLAEMVQEHVDDEGWSTFGDIEVSLRHAEDLPTGVFRINSRVDPDAGPRRRPIYQGGEPVDPNAGNAPGYGMPVGVPAGVPAPAGASGPADAGYAPEGGYGGDPQYSYRAQQPATGAPSGATSATRHWLIVDGTDRRVALEPGVNVVGRGQDADLRLADTGVSRRHIEIRFDGQSAVLHDLGSTNGTIVNGHRVQSWQLADGDVIRVGHSVLVYRQAPA
jgi:FhaA, N-terminal domain/FHA domain